MGEEMDEYMKQGAKESFVSHKNLQDGGWEDRRRWRLDIGGKYIRCEIRYTYKAQYCKK